MAQLAYGVFILFIAGLIIGIVVTALLHDSSTIWARRIGETRYRYANLPVGGILATAAGLALDGHEAHYAFAAAAGMALAAIGGAWLDPAID